MFYSGYNGDASAESTESEFSFKSPDNLQQRLVDLYANRGNAESGDAELNNGVEPMQIEPENVSVDNNSGKVKEDETDEQQNGNDEIAQGAVGGQAQLKMEMADKPDAGKLDKSFDMLSF